MTKEEQKEAQSMRCANNTLDLYVTLCSDHQIKINDRVFTYGEIQKDLNIKGYLLSSYFNFWLNRIYPKYLKNGCQMNLFDKI